MKNDLKAAEEWFRQTLSCYCEEGDRYAQRAKAVYETALSALRDVLQRQPDPETGLVPCGCGGKAMVWPSDLRQAMVTAYQVGCIECAMTTVWVRGKQENAVKVWNTAMGHRA